MNPPKKSPVLSPSRAEILSELPAIAQAIRSPLPFFIAGGAAMWAGAHTAQNPQLTIAYTLFAYLMGLLIHTDLKHGILPHILTNLVIILGTLLAPSLGLSYTSSILGSFIAFGGLFGCAMLTERLTGKASLGGGDLWLVMGLGAWLGAGGLPMLLVATAVTGAISVGINRWLNRGMLTYAGHPANAFPFGPALCVAGWLALLYAPCYWQVIEMLSKQA